MCIYLCVCVCVCVCARVRSLFSSASQSPRTSLRVCVQCIHVLYRYVQGMSMCVWYGETGRTRQCQDQCVCVCVCVVCVCGLIGRQEEVTCNIEQILVIVPLRPNQVTSCRSNDGARVPQQLNDVGQCTGLTFCLLGTEGCSPALGERLSTITTINWIITSS
jgi:hypothetical protein